MPSPAQTPQPPQLAHLAHRTAGPGTSHGPPAPPAASVPPDLLEASLTLTTPTRFLHEQGQYTVTPSPSNFSEVNLFESSFSRGLPGPERTQGQHRGPASSALPPLAEAAPEQGTTTAPLDAHAPSQHSLFLDRPLSLSAQALISPPLPLFALGSSRPHYYLPLVRNERYDDIPIISDFRTEAPVSYPGSHLPGAMPLYDVAGRGIGHLSPHVADSDAHRAPSESPTITAAKGLYAMRLPSPVPICTDGPAPHPAPYLPYRPSMAEFISHHDPAMVSHSITAFTSPSLFSLELKSTAPEIPDYPVGPFLKPYYGISRIGDGLGVRTRPNEPPAGMEVAAAETDVTETAAALLDAGVVAAAAAAAAAGDHAATSGAGPGGAMSTPSSAPATPAPSADLLAAEKAYAAAADRLLQQRHQEFLKARDAYLRTAELISKNTKTLLEGASGPAEAQQPEPSAIGAPAGPITSPDWPSFPASDVPGYSTGSSSGGSAVPDVADIGRGAASGPGPLPSLVPRFSDTPEARVRSFTANFDRRYTAHSAALPGAPLAPPGAQFAPPYYRAEHGPAPNGPLFAPHHGLDPAMARYPGSMELRARTVSYDAQMIRGSSLPPAGPPAGSMPPHMAYGHPAAGLGPRSGPGSLPRLGSHPAPGQGMIVAPGGRPLAYHPYGPMPPYGVGPHHGPQHLQQHPPGPLMPSYSHPSLARSGHPLDGASSQFSIESAPQSSSGRDRRLSSDSAPDSLVTSPTDPSASRRDKILERNRQAAIRSRQKKKKELEDLVKTLDAMEDRYMELEEQLRDARTRRDLLRQRLLAHRGCQCDVIGTYERLQRLQAKNAPVAGAAGPVAIPRLFDDFSAGNGARSMPHSGISRGPRTTWASQLRDADFGGGAGGGAGGATDEDEDDDDDDLDDDDFLPDADGHASGEQGTNGSHRRHVSSTGHERHGQGGGESMLSPSKRPRTSSVGHANR